MKPRLYVGKKYRIMYDGEGIPERAFNGIGIFTGTRIDIDGPCAEFIFGDNTTIDSVGISFTDDKGYFPISCISKI